MYVGRVYVYMPMAKQIMVADLFKKKSCVLASSLIENIMNKSIFETPPKLEFSEPRNIERIN